ncbi:hypothetical protein BJX64DRAFT_142044 [Aspergillus heterothallicus]
MTVPWGVKNPQTQSSQPTASPSIATLATPTTPIPSTCVEATARHAFELGNQVTILKDVTAGCLRELTKECQRNLTNNKIQPSPLSLYQR